MLPGACFFGGGIGLFLHSPLPLGDGRWQSLCYDFDLEFGGIRVRLIAHKIPVPRKRFSDPKKI